MAGTTTEKAAPTVELQFTRDAVIALLKEARRAFENGARELYSCDDVEQLPTIAACTEITGRLHELVEHPLNWPTKQTPHGKEELPYVTVEFTRKNAPWFEWNRDNQRAFVDDLENGNSGGDPGYEVEQVYLLHVLERIVRQLDEGQVA